MLIYENGSYQQCTAYPDTLFDTNAKYVISDSNPLAQQYIEYYDMGLSPYLIFNNDGSIAAIGYDTNAEKRQENEMQIAILKQQLSDSDYKIIKCYEASLVGKELPYDIITLTAEREVIRDEINELEGE